MGRGSLDMPVRHSENGKCSREASLKGYISGYHSNGQIDLKCQELDDRAEGLCKDEE